MQRDDRSFRDPTLCSVSRFADVSPMSLAPREDESLLVFASELTTSESQGLFSVKSSKTTNSVKQSNSRLIRESR